MDRLSLPLPPASVTGPVKAWPQPIEIETYQPAAPDRNPMFLEKRVYQGSSGRVYPLPFTDRVATRSRPRSWQALHIENRYVRAMVLPELGGRIHVGLDKANGYDFFYRQNVIKPALVGLAGPWISGGVEFNWPQHHRPATFMPAEWTIEESTDGSRTIWCGDYDPLTRMKSAHGICLHPERAYLELKVRLYNRTPLTQTFLWWANVATRVHELYQSFFPPDVHFVADHAKRAVSTFPLCSDEYYGIDYAQRAHNGVPAYEAPRHFVPPGSYAANDLSWYANIPVPTSYMALGSRFDFCGGYDHHHEAGLVHVANHHISPGKKQWTWGNHDFGYAWDKNLTDDDGPYIELMAGVYTDNQPDFSFLAPGETKTFSQFWYPIRHIGVPQQANRNAALSLRFKDGLARLGLHVTVPFPQATIRVQRSDETVAEWITDLAPEQPFFGDARLPDGCVDRQVSIQVLSDAGQEIVCYEKSEAKDSSPPQPATEPAAPAGIASNDELYLTGLHLEQYRHATRPAELYWREALRRDPGDSRCNHALGLWHLRRGEFARAEELIRRAIATLTRRNPNPADGEPYYSLGLALRYQGHNNEAYDAFYKAAWSFAWRAPAYFALAELDMARGDFHRALEHLDVALSTNADHNLARNLKVIALRKLGQSVEASAFLSQTLALDPLDTWARELAGDLKTNNQTRLDIAYDLMRAGLVDDARRVLQSCDLDVRDGSVPMVLYTSAYLDKAPEKSAEAASTASPDYCFPSRLEEMIVLEAILRNRPTDARAHYYLGNWLYDRKRYEDAIQHWERSAERDPSYSVVWRNLGIAYFNVRRDALRATAAFERAIEANSDDARLRYERDQLWKRTGAAPDRRIKELTSAQHLVEERDDLTVELAALYNQNGEPQRAAMLFEHRRFQPWEGGEGAALGQFARTQLALARVALQEENASAARRYLHTALDPPENLGEAWHLLANRSNLYYWLGLACEADGGIAEARSWWTKAADSSRDFEQMSVRSYSAMTYYSALALRRLKREPEARHLLRALACFAKELAHASPAIDYFATSLPAMLLFEDDLEQRRDVHALLLEALAGVGLGYRTRGARLLNRILQIDPNHAAAADCLAELQAETVLAERLAMRT